MKITLWASILFVAVSLLAVGLVTGLQATAAPVSTTKPADDGDGRNDRIYACRKNFVGPRTRDNFAAAVIEVAIKKVDDDKDGVYDIRPSEYARFKQLVYLYSFELEEKIGNLLGPELSVETWTLAGVENVPKRVHDAVAAVIESHKAEIAADAQQHLLRCAKWVHESRKR